MNFLIITNELQLEELSPELRKIYNAYQGILKKRTEFYSLRGLQITNPSLYDRECKRLASTTKYISYRADRKTFIVRPTVDYKRVFLGSEKSFDDACYLLSEYLKMRILYC